MSSRTLLSATLCIAAWLILPATVVAQSEPDAGSCTQAAGVLGEIQQRWAEINYQLPEKQRRDAFAGLAATVDAAVQQRPDDAALVTWQGIVYSTWAGTGGFGALSRAKTARKAFERAIGIDGTALAGSAHTSLGVLYHEVPGWPIGFGDEDKAREQLERGLALNPDGIDSNYFLGTWLMDQDHPAEARVRLEHALRAPDRPCRPIADQGRRAEVRAALAKLPVRGAAG